MENKKNMLTGATNSTVQSDAIMTYEKTNVRKQNGLMGNFYGDKDFKNLLLIRGNSCMNEQINSNEIKNLRLKKSQNIQSVRWQGFIQPKEDGVYTFSAGKYDQVMIQVDNCIVVDNIGREEEIKLQKDKLYKIIVEYQVNPDVEDAFTLLWGTEEKKEVVPHEVLYAPSLALEDKPTVQGSLHQLKYAVNDFIREESDRDGDNIPDGWEYEGYTVVDGEFGVKDLVKWDDDIHGPPLVKYKSSPMKWSTSDDPYSDYEKVTGLQMDTRVTKEAHHPLVAAYPDVHIDMEKYLLIPNTNFQSGEGGGSSKQVTRGTSSTVSNTESWGTTVTANASLLDFGGSVSASYESSTTTSVTKDESVSDSTEENWNTVLGINTAEAGKILPNVRYVNTGTAPVFKVRPQFTLHFPKTVNGDAISLISSLVGETHKGLEVLPENTYPDKSKPPLAFDKPTHFGESLMLDQGNVSRLQMKDMLKLETNGIEAKVVLIDTQGQDYESSLEWTNVISKIKANTAEIVFTTVEGPVTKRNVAAPGITPVEQTVPEITFKEALKLSYGAIENNGKLYINDREITKDTISLIVDQATEAAMKKQGVQSVFDVKSKAGMHIEMTEEVIASVINYGDGGAAFNIYIPNGVAEAARFEMYMNGQKKGDMGPDTFITGQKSWSGDVSYFGVNYTEAFDSNNTFELKVKERTVATFKGLYAGDNAVKTAHKFSDWYYIGSWSKNGLYFQPIASNISNEITHYKYKIEGKITNTIPKPAPETDGRLLVKFGAYTLTGGKLLQIYAINKIGTEINVFEISVGL
ncbi:binary toxin-like calcium binding domain-containing protein [Bacillus mycoides]|uniref:binary toxin-like calcium binding domain-containing protein n=1 Tax=Bacillus mycoides TaxID=1405 RepID=UPI001C02BDE2|nr:binary toxin-like calcium binding domain-containing protein [Bacillus mycoides]QWG87540.1 peptidase [Bacillus mycoides]